MIADSVQIEQNIFSKDLLLLEYNKNYDKICLLEKNALNFITIIIALLGFFGVVFFTSGKTVDFTKTLDLIIINLLPLFINSMILYAQLYTVRTHSLGGYLKFIEMQINKSCKQEVLLWETYFAEKEQKSLFSVVLLFVFILIFLIFSIIPYYIYIIYYSVIVLDNTLWLLSFVFMIVSALELIILITLIYNVLTIHKKTYEKCLVLYNLSNKSIKNTNRS